VDGYRHHLSDILEGAEKRRSLLEFVEFVELIEFVEFVGFGELEGCG